MALSSTTKKVLIFSSIASAGLASFLMFKLGKKEEFIDNVWCADGKCSNVNPETYESEQTYDTPSSSEPINTGYVQLLFKNKHSFSAGDEIFVKQTGDRNGNVTNKEYDGWHKVVKVLTPYILRLNIDRIKSSPMEGGYVQSESWWKRTF